MDENRVALYLMGISCSQLRAGAYAMLLAEVDGSRRIPVIIGEGEAQSIALAIEGIQTPRPLTHDLFITFAHAFGVRLQEVFINRFSDGIFYSQLTFSDDSGRTVVTDARTSDAIALAIRTDTPIFTTESIISQTGFIIEDDKLSRDTKPASEESLQQDSKDRTGYHASPRLENYSIEELEKELTECIQAEDYEKAEIVNEILLKKKNKL